MKAIVLRAFGSADNFVAADVPIPEVGPGEVRVRVRAVSFNPVDYQIREGKQSCRLHSMILGRDLSGSVDAVHGDVSDFAIGDKVFGYVCDRASTGTYAEYVSVPVELLAKKPASLSYAEAAAVPVAAITATLALNKVGARRATSMFIAGGAGGVGTLAIGLARRLGVRKLVTTAGNSESRAYLVKRCGLHPRQIIDYHDEAFIQRALDRNRGPFDVALDLVGGRMLSATCALLAVDGNLASITEAPGHDDVEVLFQKNASFHFVGANAYSLTDDRTAWRRYREILQQLAWYLDGGTLAPPAITVLGGLTPEVVKHAHALLESHSVQGKLVMTV